MWGTADDGDTWYQVGEFDGGKLEALGSGSPHFFNALNDLIVAGDRLLAVGKFVEWSSTERDRTATATSIPGRQPRIVPGRRRRVDRHLAVPLIR